MIAVMENKPGDIVWEDRDAAYTWLMIVRSKPTSHDAATALALKMGGRIVN